MNLGLGNRVAYLLGVLQSGVSVVCRAQGLQQGGVEVATGLDKVFGEGQLLPQHVVKGKHSRAVRTEGLGGGRHNIGVVSRLKTWAFPVDKRLGLRHCVNNGDSEVGETMRRLAWVAV